MFPPIALIRSSLFALLIGWAALLPVRAESPSANPRQTWQMLDYIAVDYAGAVQSGRIVAPGEYAEMQEFAGAVRAQLARLPVTPEQPVLLGEADRLTAAVAAKAEPTEVAALARRLADDLLASYPIGAVPASPPDLSRGAALYAQQCAACHGPSGHGDGLAAAGLDPPPIAFTDAARAAQRTPFALYEVISQGVPGTAMASFAGLSEADRWALAFYVGSLAYSPQARTDGEALWRQNADAHGRIPTLEALTRTREADLAAMLSAEQAHAIVAYLRSRPQAVNDAVAGAGPLALARQRLADSQRAYAAGDTAHASTLALSAYLDGVEPIEPTLATRNAALLREIESAMARYRTQLGRRTAPADIATQATQINALFDRAEAVLQDSHTDTTTAFLGSFTILVREGLEALLIVIGMIAFLRKAERREVLPYVHAGWVGALLAGAATWAVATYLVDISGANREVTEGLSSLFAAAVLLSVGMWMHQKSVAGRWQTYLQTKMSSALSKKSAMFLFGLSFIAVYREVFETILFYAALWDQGNNGAILAGLAAGALALLGLSVLLLRYSAKLPLGKFFAVSSMLVAVLAVVLTGKGIAALQEAGWIGSYALATPRIDLLGIFPSVQTLLAQLIVGVVVVAAFVMNSRATGSRR